MTHFWQSLPHPIIGLAPMDGVTDAPFRLTVALQGRPDVIFTEFTAVMDVCRGPAHLLSSLIYSEAERPVVAQLYGKNPDLFYQAAHIVCELGFDGLDINMGCPSRNVAASGSGAGLIRTPDLAHEIMRAARQGIADWAAGRSLAAAGLKESRSELVRTMNRRRGGQTDPPAARRVIPLSVKTRIGYDTVIVERWIEHLLAEQPVAISVHGRTLEQMYRGEADWSAIGRATQLARKTDTLLLGNGDVQSLQDVVRRVRQHGVHGVLVGRGTLGEPWLFRQKEAARAAVSDATRAVERESLSLEERFRVMLDHARQYEAILDPQCFPRMRKHLGWYCKGFPGAAAMRAAMVRASSSEDVVRLVADHRAGLFLRSAAPALEATATVA
ncbi:MAG TPA: tRNA-dihydrouridine synthase family protein [Nitrospiraceae bacterium]|nr:tRNA-dihydrouridine synthase family protein [Nitrospiraceae bacterium]